VIYFVLVSKIFTDMVVPFWLIFLILSIVLKIIAEDPVVEEVFLRWSCIF